MSEQGTAYRPSYVYADNIRPGDTVRLSSEETGEGTYRVLRRDVPSRSAVFVGLTLKHVDAPVMAYAHLVWFPRREKVLRTAKGPLS